MRTCAGGALNNNGPHPIDHAMMLFGDAVPEVWAEARTCLCSGDAEDHLKIILSGQGHPTVEVELSDTIAYGQERWLVAGTAGGLRGNASHLEWKWVDWSTMPTREVDEHSTPDRSYNSEALTWQYDSWDAPDAVDSGGGAAPVAGPTRDLYRDLYLTIREGKPQVITPASVRTRLAVMARVRAAAGIPASL